MILLSISGTVHYHIKVSKKIRKISEMDKNICENGAYVENHFLSTVIYFTLRLKQGARERPAKSDEDTVVRLIKLRTVYPNLKPKKIAVLYQKAYPEEQVLPGNSIYRISGKVGLYPTQTYSHCAARSISSKKMQIRHRQH